MCESDEQYQYSVAWIDCLARGKSLGRSVLMRGNHALAAQLPPSIGDPLTIRLTPRWTVPFDFPSVTLNRFSVGAFNALYYGFHPNAKRQLVSCEKFFYPLDSILHWNRMYGKRGFVQYQMALPENRGPEGLKVLLERLGESQRASFLAVLKRFGAPNPGLLSFPISGYTLALDLPVSKGLIPLLHDLDQLVLRYGGRIYLAKDATLRAEDFQSMYPALGQFRAVKKKLDPGGIFSSSQARRLRIVEG
jgi:FAD/FMN-containing dehydrogenase